MRVVGRLSPEEFWARIAQDEQLLHDNAAVLPVYRVADWAGPVLIGDWGWENGELVTVGIAHDDRTGAGTAVHVRTRIHDPRADVASLRIHAEGPYDPADALRRRRADAIPPGEDVAIRVDSPPGPVRAVARRRSLVGGRHPRGLRARGRGHRSGRGPALTGPGRRHRAISGRPATRSTSAPRRDMTGSGAPA